MDKPTVICQTRSVKHQGFLKLFSKLKYVLRVSSQTTWPWHPVSSRLQGLATGLEPSMRKLNNYVSCLYLLFKYILWTSIFFYHDLFYYYSYYYCYYCYYYSYFYYYYRIRLWHQLRSVAFYASNLSEIRISEQSCPPTGKVRQEQAGIDNWNFTAKERIRILRLLIFKFLLKGPYLAYHAGASACSQCAAGTYGGLSGARHGLPALRC
jgi:hypothetical protein